MSSDFDPREVLARPHRAAVEFVALIDGDGPRRAERLDPDGAPLILGFHERIAGSIWSVYAEDAEGRQVHASDHAHLTEALLAAHLLRAPAGAYLGRSVPPILRGDATVDAEVTVERGAAA